IPTHKRPNKIFPEKLEKFSKVCQVFRGFVDCIYRGQISLRSFQSGTENAIQSEKFVVDFVSFLLFLGSSMMDKLNGFAEKIANQVSLPRRGFLLTLGGSALAFVGLLTGRLAARSPRGPVPILADNGPGACFWTQNGQNCCEIATQNQCAAIT